MTILRFKLMKVKIKGQQISFDPVITPALQSEMVKQEQILLKTLKKSQRAMKVIKLIPDELPFYFWGKDAKSEITSYCQNLKAVCDSYYPETEIIKMTDLLKDPQTQQLYDQVYQLVYQSFDTNFNSPFVDQKMFEQETLKRSGYYSTKPLSKRRSQDLAKKAFALFAAESAVIYQLEQSGQFPDLYLLGRDVPVDSYKYDFFKYPANRPDFRKLYVL